VVARQLERQYGAVNAHYFHVYGTIELAGGSEFLPLIKADAPGGVLLVNSLGEVFRQQSLQLHPGGTPDAIQADVQRRLQKRPENSAVRFGDRHLRAHRGPRNCSLIDDWHQGARSGGACAVGAIQDVG
jgi:hypothetical protein